MKEIRISQETGQTISAANQTTGTIVTLRDLKGILPDTQRVKKPKYSDLCKEQPLLTKPLPDGGIWVYANGFMVYRGESSRPYVLRVSEIKTQTYEFADKTESCALDDLPWETALFLFGDEHRERNLLEWNERTQVQYDGFDECFDDSQSQGLVLPSSENVEQTVANKLDDRMEQILSLRLTASPTKAARPLRNCALCGKPSTTFATILPPSPPS